MDASTPAKTQYINNNRMAGTLDLDSNFNADIIVKIAKNVMDGKTEDKMTDNIAATSQTPGETITATNRMVNFDYTYYTGNLLDVVD